MTSPKDEIKRYTLRVEKSLLDRIEKSADRSRRSIAKEIAFGMEFYLNSKKEETA